MQVKIHSGNGGRAEVLLLAVEFAVGELRIAHLAHGFDEHATRAAGGVIDGLAWLRLKQGDHHLDDLAWGIEFSCVLFLHVGELLDQVFVGVAHHVGAIAPVAELLC